VALPRLRRWRRTFGKEKTNILKKITDFFTGRWYSSGVIAVLGLLHFINFSFFMARYMCKRVSLRVTVQTAVGGRST
jgi:hypothetical protein